MQAPSNQEEPPTQLTEEECERLEELLYDEVTLTLLSL